MMKRDEVEKTVQDKRERAFAAIITELVQAIDMCIKGRLFLAGQMLMYAGIDIMGNFDRGKTKLEGDQQDFKRWAKKYVLDPNPRLTVNADDLYGGRCGLIHAAIIESGKSRRGEARLIFPVLKPAPIAPLQESLDQLRRDDPTFHGVAVYLDDLLKAFIDGLGKYREDVESSPQKAELKATPRDVDASKLDIEVPVIAASKAKESVAGMLAQAKFMASQQLGTDLLKFNLGMVDFGDLGPLLKGRKRTEESPGSIRLEFVGTDRHSLSLWFQANTCLISDADITNFKNHVDGQLGSRPAESCEELVVETMRLLDGEACWNCVRTVATALVNEGHGRRLDEEELMRLLASGQEGSE